MIIEWLFIAIAAALLARRAVECSLVSRTLRMLAQSRRRALGDGARENGPYIVVLVPLLREQTVAAELLDHFEQLRYDADRLRIVFITTANEGAEADTTFAVLGKLINSRPAHFRHLHYTSRHRYRAEQLNYAVVAVTADLAAEETFVGVYNADSRPDVDTLEVFRADAGSFRSRAGQYPAAYQQPARYYVAPRQRRRGAMLRTTAAFQTVWTLAHFIRRLYKAERDNGSAGHGPNSGVPVSFLGHGEFIRLDVLHAVGDFPNFAYGDGLLLGWILALRGHSIRVLPAFDNCEVPPSPFALIRQHAAWFVALSNLNTAIRQVFHGQQLGTAGRRVAAFAMRRHISTVAWGLRPLLAALWVTSAAFTARPLPLAIALGTLLIVAAAPDIYLAAYHPSVSATLTREKSLIRRIPVTIATALPAYLIDGLGFWLMLWLRMVERDGPIVPAKTER